MDSTGPKVVGFNWRDRPAEAVRLLQVMRSEGLTPDDGTPLVEQGERCWKVCWGGSNGWGLKPLKDLTGADAGWGNI